MWIKKNSAAILLTLVILIGLGLLAYPSFSNWWNSFHQSRALASYSAVVANLETEDFDEYFTEAESYNSRLRASGLLWDMTEEQRALYYSLLNMGGSGMMGYIDIPKINLTLPVYHGTDETTLQVAIGHLEATSLPTGGKGTHCVVSGHRGLPSAKLFSNLDRLETGDTWTMTVLNRTLTYEVDQIRVVLPFELSDIQIDPDKDYCTLLTCTPYGINTHRLLVRGHRIENVREEINVVADMLQIRTIYIAPFIAVPALLFLIIVMLFTTGFESRSRRRTRIIMENYLTSRGLTAGAGDPIAISSEKGD